MTSVLAPFALLLAVPAPHSPGARITHEPVGEFAVGGEVNALAAAPDGSVVAVVARGGVTLWRAATRSATSVKLPSPAASVAAAPDQRGFFAGTSKGTVVAVGRDGRIRWDAPAGGRAVKAIAVSPDGSLVAAGSDDGRVRILRAADGSLVRETPAHAKAIVGVGFTAGGRAVLSFDDGAAQASQVYAAAPFTAPGSLQHEKFGPFHIFAAATSDDHVAIVGQYRYLSKRMEMEEDDRIMVYHGRERDPEHQIRPEMITYDIRSAALASDSRFLAVATERGNQKQQGTAIVWEIEREEPRVVLDLPASGRAVALSADGTLLAAGDSKGNVIVRRLVGMESDLTESVASKAVGAPLAVPGPSASASQACEAPQVEIQEPAEVNTRGSVSVKARSLLVRGRVTDPCGRGVEGVWVNGERVGALEAEGGGAARFSAYVALSPGEQQVELRAVSLDGWERGRQFRVQAAPPSLPELRNSNSGARAVVIGISRHQEPSLNLGFADRDASRFAETLLASSGLRGFNRDSVNVMVNERATRQDIAHGLAFLNQSTENDVVVLFYAGHGGPGPVAEGGAPRYYLIPHDARVADVATTAIPMSEVTLLLRTVKARHLIVFVDACHSGGIGGEDVSLGATRRLPGGGPVNDINTVFLRRVEQAQPSRVVFASAERNQVAYEPPDLAGGVFTHFLTAGLKGDADENTDGIVTLGELLEFVRASVRHYTKGLQVPAISGTSYDRELPLAIVAK